MELWDLPKIILTVNIEKKDLIKNIEGLKFVNGFADNENLIVTVERDSKQKLYLANIKSAELKDISGIQSGNGDYKDDEEKKLLYKEEYLGLSGNGKKLLYSSGDELYLYDIENKSSKKIKNFDEEYINNIQFGDYDGNSIVYIDSKTSKFIFKNISTGDKKELKTNGQNIMACNEVKVNKGDSNIYFDAHIGNKYGVYYANTNKMDEVKLLFELHGKEDTIGQFDFIGNKNCILFAGEYNSNPGIFIYDLGKKSVTKLVSGLKDKEGCRCPFYSLSKGGSKILFEVLNAKMGYKDIYAANLNGKALTSRKCIYKSANTYGSIPVPSWWTPDGKKVVVDGKKYDESIKDRKYDLRIFEFN